MAMSCPATLPLWPELPDEGVTFTVRLPVDPPTANSRLCWQAKARPVRAVRQTVAMVARSERNRLRVPRATGRRRLELTLLRGPRTRDRDHDQTVAALKPVVDGLRDAGWIVDDRRAWLDYPMPGQGRDPQGGVAVVVRVLPA